jgi:glycosyltransferase involved in cell wall biosynthesis
MSNLLLVSVVTPSFNQAPFLEQTIRSVLEQDYVRIEYIIVDGGSTDGSVDIIKKYADRFAWWVSEKDSGQAEGINKGLRRARGEIVAWLNSDDIYLPGAVSAAMKVFEQNPRAGLVYGDGYSMDGAGRFYSTMKAAQWDVTDLLSFHILSQPAVFMRRAVLEQAGYLDETYHLLLDHQLWIKMAVRAPMVHVPAVWAAGRVHAEAKNSKRAALFGEEAFRILEWAETQPVLEDHVRQNRKQVRAGAYRLNSFYLTDSGQPSAALKSYWKSFVIYPPAALGDWKHILLALAEGLGFKKLRRVYLGARLRRYRKQNGRGS